MKMILPMMLIAALPLGADAQNKSGLVMSNLDKTVSQQTVSISLLQADGKRIILFLLLTAVMAVLTSWLRTTTSASTPFFLNSRRRLTRLEPLSRNCLISTNSLWMLTAATRLESLQ